MDSNNSTSTNPTLPESTKSSSVIDSITSLLTGKASPSVDFNFKFDITQVLIIALVVIIVGLILIYVSKKVSS